MWRQLSKKYSDKPALIALYRRITNGADGQLGGATSVSLLEIFDAFVQYRNGVFGHGSARFDSFYEHDMGPLLFPAVNELLKEGVLEILGVRGSRLVCLAGIRKLDDQRFEVGIDELIDSESLRMAHHSSTQTPWSRVLELAKKSVRADPISSDYRETLGAAHFRAGELQLAEKELLEAKRLFLKTEKSKSSTGGGSGGNAAANLSTPNTAVETVVATKDSQATYFIHVFLALTYHELKQPDKCVKERQILTSIPPPKKDEYRDQAYRDLLSKEIERVCGPLPKSPEIEGEESK